MAVAKTTEELQRLIMDEMQKAMNETAKQAEQDMHEGTEYFYNGGTPRRYVRTGALGNTPKTSPVVQSGNEVSFNAYLDKNYTYNSGDSPSMGQALDLANYGTPWRTSGGGWANPTVGNKGFWEKSEEKIEESFNRIMGKHFP